MTRGELIAFCRDLPATVRRIKFQDATPGEISGPIEIEAAPAAGPPTIDELQAAAAKRARDARPSDTASLTSSAPVFGAEFPEPPDEATQ